MGHKRTRPRPARLQAARHWIPTYTGKNIVKGYKKKFSVDILAAIRDLQELGIDISPEYIASVENSEKHRIMQLQAKKQERLAEQQALEEQYNEMLFLDDYHNYDDSQTQAIKNVRARKLHIGFFVFSFHIFEILPSDNIYTHY